MKRWSWAFLGCLACSPDGAVAGSGTGSSTGDGSETTTSSSSGSTSVEHPTSSDDTSGAGGESDEGASFIFPTGGSICDDRLPDGVQKLSIECSLTDQDCCPGEACKAWSNDGSGTWNGSRCYPVEEDPGQLGEACVAQDVAFSGIDSCDIGLMCWNVDAETLEGRCAKYCETSVDCEQPSETCSISNDGDLPLCLPVCDPLAQNCEDGFGCYPSAGDEFVCIREGDLVHVDGLYHPSCPPGSFAATLEQMPSCVEGELCCASFCDQNDDVPCGETASCEPLPSSGVGYCRTL